MSYKDKQNLLRDQAIDWQLNQAPDMDWYTYAQWMAYFETMGRRYGLLQEFRENGIL